MNKRSKKWEKLYGKILSVDDEIDSLMSGRDIGFTSETDLRVILPLIKRLRSEIKLSIAQGKKGMPDNEKKTTFPNLSALAKSKFYPDEAFNDPRNQNGCDTCPRAAEYMTTGSDDCEYYICKKCVKKYGIEWMIEREHRNG